MKKFLLLFTFLLASFSMVKAFELTVADGTSSTSNVPAYGLYADTEGARAQCLYPSDLLTEMVGGQISQITFYLTTPATEAWTGTFQLSLGTTETTTLSAFIDDDLTAVYTGAMDATGATMTVEFATPFTYTGGNLVVDWYVTTAGNYKSATFTAMALNGAGRYRNSASASGSAANYLPKATFEYTSGSVGPTCERPNVPVVSAITATGATIAWDGGSGTYNVEYKEASAPDTAWISLLIGTTALSAPLADLSPATDYKVRVQSYCSELDTVSRWSTASFTTYNELPLDEPFKGSTIPAGWQRYSGLLRSVLNDTAYTSTSSGWTFASVAGVFDGGYHAKVNVYGTGCKYWLVTPATYINISNAQLTFDLALTDYGNADPIEDPTAQLDDKFVVLVKQEVDTNWTILRQWDNAGSTYVYNDIATAGQQVTIDLGAYNGHAVQIAFYAESTASGGDNDLRIDNVLIDRVPDCAGPSDFKIVPGSVSKNSAQLSWTANSGETSWIVQYKKSSVNAWTSVNTTSNPFTLTGLKDSTAYDVRVAAYCDPADPTALSAFTKYISFQTAIAAPYEQGFKSLPGDWTRYTALLDSLWMGEDSLKAVTTGWTVGTGNGVFDSHLKLTISGTTTRNWIVSPFISVGDEMQLSFDMALTKSTGTTPVAVELGAQPDDKFAVLITDDGGATWTDLQIWDNTSAAESFDLINSTKDGQTKTYDLTAYAGQTIAIAFYGESTVSNTSSIIHVDNVSIDSIPGCTAPTDVTVSDVSDTSAVITWFEELGANWEYCLLMTNKADSVPAENAYISTTAHSVVLDTLSEVSNYVFLVRKNCGGVYSEPVVRTIKTLKSPYKIPFEETFDKTTIPSDWSRYSTLLTDAVLSGSEPLTSSTSGWSFGTANGVFDNHAKINIYGTSCKYWLVTPQVNLAANTAQLTFDLALTTYSGTTTQVDQTQQADDKFVVLISENNGASWAILRQWDNAGSQYVYNGIAYGATGEHITLNISNYAGKNVLIAFYGESTVTGGDNELHVDNVTIESIPTCLKPTDLTVSDITAAGATFKWAPVEGANWQYCALANATKDSIPEDAAFISTTADSITLSNLEQQTNYVFFLRKDCGAEDGYSAIVTASFQTSQLPVALPFADDFEGENNWLLINGELTNHWMIGTGAHKDGAKALYITDNDSLNHYSNSAAMVYATKAIQIQNDSDMYAVKLDWKGWGEGSYDYLRAAIVPASVTLEAATTAPTGFSSTALPTGWIAADGGSKLNLDSAKWSTSAAEVMIPKAGTYNIVLAWRNDGSGGAQPPIAVDNFSMQRISCPKPSGLAVSKISSDSAKVSWKYQEGANYEYCLIATKNVDTIPAANAFLPVSADTSVMVLKSLTQVTDYVFFLRKNCGENDLSDYISIAFTTKQTPIDIDPIFEDDFEDAINWVFLNGELENHWIIDTAAHNGSGEKAMYISNNDTANAYTLTKQAMVYATKAFNFEKGSYIFKYDWKANGETSTYGTKYDYLRVALVPYEAELAASTTTPTGFGPSALPTGCIALDGGTALNLQTEWQTVTTNEIAVEKAGAYMMVFAWRNNTSGGNQTPAAIDNVSITKLSCPAPSNVIIPDSSRTASSVTIYWAAADTAQHKWEIAYDTIALFNPDTVSNPIVVMDTLAYTFSGLDESTTYYVYVHAVCSETSESDWSPKATFSTTSACETPAALVAKDVTYHSALINWNAYGLDTFNIRYASATDTVWTEVLNVTRPFAIDSLEPATLYGVQVQPACNDTVWSEALTFKTGYLMPLLEEFPTSTIPADWSRYYGWLDDVMDGTADLTATTSYWVFGSNNGVFDSHARLNIYGTSCNRWLVTPAVHVEGNVQLTFDMALTKYSGTLAPVDSTQQLDDKFVVLVSENGGESWTILRQWDNAGSEYVYNNIVCSADGQPVAINLSAYSGKDIKIAFYGESTVTGGDNNLHIDNVLIDEIPSCIKPTGLKVLGVEATTAEFAWNAEEGAVWQYAYLADAAIDSIPADAAFASLDTNFVELNALTPMTNYVFFLRRNCGEVDGYSKIVAKAFTTKQLAVELPFADDFENGNSWLLYNGELENAWAWGTATNNGGTHALYISNDEGASNAYTNNKSAVVYATKRIHLEEDGQYIFSYDWMANGESTYDYLRVALVPDSIASFEASTSLPTGLSATGLPTGWIALDGGSKLNLSTAWANESVTKQLNAGLYQIVLVWRDDSSSGTNPPAAIDNFSVIQKLCVVPADLNATVTTTSATLSWTSEAEAWQLVYSENADFNPDSVTATNVSANSYVLAGLTAEATYYFAVRTNCGDNFFSDWSAISSFTTASPCVPQSEILYDTICPGETYTFGEQELTTAGEYVDTLTNVAGCDSIITLYLAVYDTEDTIFVAEVISESDLPYTYQAQYVEGESPIFYDLGTEPGVYSDTALVEGVHCDAVLVLELTINKAQGIDNIFGDGENVHKVLYRDVLYIIINDEWYTAAGQKVDDPRE